MCKTFSVRRSTWISRRLLRRGTVDAYLFSGYKSLIRPTWGVLEHSRLAPDLGFPSTSHQLLVSLIAQLIEFNTRASIFAQQKEKELRETHIGAVGEGAESNQFTVRNLPGPPNSSMLPGTVICNWTFAGCGKLAFSSNGHWNIFCAYAVNIKCTFNGKNKNSKNNNENVIIIKK